MLSILLPEFRVIAPELILSATAFIIIIWEMITRSRDHAASAYLAIAGSLVALVVTLSSSNLNLSTFGNARVLDPFASFFKVIFLMGLLLCVSLSLKFVQESGAREHAEYYSSPFRKNYLANADGNHLPT